MYKIIGADNTVYGPVTAEVMRQWLAEGRVNHQTLVQAEGAAEWKPLSTFPEWSAWVASLPEARPMSTGPLATGSAEATLGIARQMVQGPAIGLLVTAILGLSGAVGGLAIQSLGMSLNAWVPPGGDEALRMINGWVSGMGVINSLLHIGIGIVILMGAWRMMKLENYGLAMAAAILALVPCISPCCLLGLPFGIWALVVLGRAEVKAAFQ